MKKKLFFITLLLVFVLISCGGDEEIGGKSCSDKGICIDFTKMGVTCITDDRAISSSCNNQITNLAVASDGTIYAAGHFTRGEEKYARAFLKALTPEGKELWEKAWSIIDGKDTPIDYLGLDSNNNIYIASVMKGSYYNNVDVIIKYSPDGDKIFELSNQAPIEFQSNDENPFFIGNGINTVFKLDKSGNIYSLRLGEYGLFMTKYSPQGEKLLENKILNLEYGETSGRGRKFLDIVDSGNKLYAVILLKKQTDIRIVKINLDDGEKFFDEEMTGDTTTPVLEEEPNSGYYYDGYNEKEGILYYHHGIDYANADIFRVSETKGVLDTFNHEFSTVGTYTSLAIKMDLHNNLFLLERSLFPSNNEVAEWLTKYDSNMNKMGSYKFNLKKMASHSSIAAVDNNGNVYLLALSNYDYEDYVDSNVGYYLNRYLINTIVKIPATEIK